MTNKLFIFFSALVIVTSVFLPVFADYTEPNFPNPIPPNCPTGSPGCDPAIDVSSVGQIKTGGLSIQGLFRALTKLLIGGTPGETPTNNLTLDVEGVVNGQGRVGADEYCDADGNFCTAAEEVNEGNKITGGQNITIESSPGNTEPLGFGDVTINAPKLIAGSYITLDPPTGKYGDVTINAERGDNWDHIAKKNIQLGGFYLSNAGADAGLLINTTGDGVFKQKLYVTGASEFTGNGLFKSTLTVDGLTTLNNSLLLHGTLIADGASTFKDSLTVLKNLILPSGSNLQLNDNFIGADGVDDEGLKFNTSGKGEFFNGLMVSGGDLTLTNNLLMPAAGLINFGIGTDQSKIQSTSATAPLSLADSNGIALQSTNGNISLNSLNLNLSVGAVTGLINLSAKDINLLGNTGDGIISLSSPFINLLGNTAIGTAETPRNLLLSNDLNMPADGIINLGNNSDRSIITQGLPLNSPLTLSDSDGISLQANTTVGIPGTSKNLTVNGNTTITGDTKIEGDLTMSKSGNLIIRFGPTSGSPSDQARIQYDSLGKALYLAGGYTSGDSPTLGGVIIANKNKSSGLPGQILTAGGYGEAVWSQRVPTFSNYSADYNNDINSMGSHHVCFLTGMVHAVDPPVTTCRINYGGSLNDNITKPTWTLQFYPKTDPYGWCSAICMDF